MWKGPARRSRCISAESNVKIWSEEQYNAISVVSSLHAYDLEASQVMTSSGMKTHGSSGFAGAKVYYTSNIQRQS